MGGVENPLVTCIAVGGGHRALDDAELLIQHLYHRRHAVGGATGIAENVPIFVAVLIGVDANHESTHFCSLARSRKNHLLSAGFKVLAGSYIVVENTRGLDDQIHAPLFPGKVGWIAVVEDFDFLAIDVNGVIGGGDIDAPQGAEHRVILEQVGIGSGITGAVETHQLDAGIGAAAQPAAHEVPTNSAESIDRNAQGHGRKGRNPLKNSDLAADHTEMVASSLGLG